MVILPDFVSLFASFGFTNCISVIITCSCWTFVEISIQFYGNTVDYPSHLASCC